MPATRSAIQLTPLNAASTHSNNLNSISAKVPQYITSAMSTPTQNDFFAEVINDLMADLHATHDAESILSLISNNLDSPVLAEIKQLTLYQLGAEEMEATLPVLTKLTGLTSLTLAQIRPSPDQIKFIFTECPSLSKVQSLNVIGVSQLKSQDLVLLSQSTILTNLTSLNLWRCYPTASRAAAAVRSRPKKKTKPARDWSGLVALLSSPVVQNLTLLNLVCTDISLELRTVTPTEPTDPIFYTTLATSPFLSNLVSLNLSESGYINADSITALAASTTLTNLTHLDLSRNNLGDEFITQLLSPPSLLPKKLQSINLGSNRITSVSTLQVLNEASPHLSELVLDRNPRLGSAGTAFIAASMPNLIKLDLSHCYVPDAGFAALAASTALTNLRSLHLEFSDVQPKSAIALVKSPVVANLTVLNMSFSGTGPKVFAAIAQSPNLSKLQQLMLRDSRAGDEGIIALAQSTTLTNLTSLDLKGNDIGPEGVHALCSSPVASKLTYLSLNYNTNIGNSIAAALAAPSSTCTISPNCACLVES